MKYACLFVHLLLWGYASHAQLPNWPPTFPYWTDSMGIRQHITNSCANLIYLYSYLEWDREQRVFHCNTPSLLRFDAIASTRYRKVKWEKIDVCRYDQAPAYSEQTSPELLLHAFDSIFEHSQVQSTGVVTYNANGYLMGSIVTTDNKKEQSIEQDTTGYNYEWVDGRLHNIQVRYGYRHHYDKQQYSSSTCGAIKKGKLDLYGADTTNIHFNNFGQPVYIEYVGVGYANKCKLRSRHMIKLIAYDKMGRLVSYIDSSVTDKHIDWGIRYKYDEVPLETVLKDTGTYGQDYSALRMPQISKWLRQKNGAALWRRDAQYTSYRQYNHKTKKDTYTNLSPLVTNSREEWIVDNNRDTWAYMSDRSKNGWLKLYQRGSDSEGDFRGEYTILYLPEADTIEYDHYERRIGFTRQFGCIVEMDYKHPRKGSILASTLTYTERNVYWSNDGLQLITYNRHLPNWVKWPQDDLEWAPEAWRPVTRTHSFTDFVLCDPNGLPKYVGSTHYLYRLTYE